MVLPGAFAQAVADADTFFRIELPALEQWSFTQAEAGRITQPVLAVVGADSHALWPGWVEGGTQPNNRPGCPGRRPSCSRARRTGYR